VSLLVDDALSAVKMRIAPLLQKNIKKHQFNNFFLIKTTIIYVVI